jgi:uncharacterized protein (DUF433 family)
MSWVGRPCFAGPECPYKRSSTVWRQAKSIVEFLEGFPSVTREQVIAFLEEAKDRLVESVA